MAQYPKYKYHAELPPVVVHSPEHEDSLGEEWADSPADHLIEVEPETDSKAEPKAKRAKAK